MSVDEEPDCFSARVAPLRWDVGVALDGRLSSGWPYLELCLSIVPVSDEIEEYAGQPRARLEERTAAGGDKAIGSWIGSLC